MPSLDLEPHEFRPRGQPRLWAKRTIIQFGLVALAIEAVAVGVLLGRPDIVDRTVLALVALFTWPWMVVIGAAIGHLWPQHLFIDDKQD